MKRTTAALLCGTALALVGQSGPAPAQSDRPKLEITKPEDGPAEAMPPEETVPAETAPGAETAAPPLPLPTPLATPEAGENAEIGDWKLETFHLPGQPTALCVVTRDYPSGDRIGFIVGPQGRGLIYGRDDLDVADGTSMDFGFSVDERPAIALDGRAYDPHSISSTPLPSPQGDKLLSIFARGSHFYIRSDALDLRSRDLPLGGAAAAVKALDACAEENDIEVAVYEPPAPDAPPPPSAGAPVPGSTFSDGGAGLGPPPPPPSAPAPAEPTAAQAAIQQAIAAQAKKRKAGVGYALALPKDVTGDGLTDIVLIFTLLEGDERKGYATALKTIGTDEFEALNTVALDGVPMDDPAIFTDDGMIVLLRGEEADKPREVAIEITPERLTIKP
ncbi:hypothetical protein L2U69_01570 [Zavarzinia compransoris]|uniref:hypothetical protein n=1 Tax=Zavarzinia marina TaxID=2911065 RepID=UPI001F2AEEF2|nr:hypothetical protein [Zavarzinia marina]MCF4164334.1 hypothetical protein [Zavarzinia marina]